MSDFKVTADHTAEEIIEYLQGPLSHAFGADQEGQQLYNERCAQILNEWCDLKIGVIGIEADNTYIPGYISTPKSILLRLAEIDTHFQAGKDVLKERVLSDWFKSGKERRPHNYETLEVQGVVMIRRSESRQYCLELLDNKGLLMRIHKGDIESAKGRKAPTYMIYIALTISENFAQFWRHTKR